MLVKLETKSNRVKGISFHPTRPWVLASLHNGAVQLWDYKTKTLIDKFDEHDGPVRGVCFHSTQPLFVSGGDDYKIKVWNYKQRKCLFTLTGHADYIRTVEFHKEYPWILSASDDLTIRIWNWQSRSCIAILTGHNHYVMSASFHPKEDLIVSASLDQTVRVWDITGLRKKNVYSPTANNAFSEDRLPQNELFANPDAVVKFVLEGHDRGVNWAQFHPTAAMIISGADDRQVKIWRYNETKAWDSETFRGHTNNVSCCTFHPRMEVILSNSEDKTIRAWDMQKKSGVQIMRREQDRFWVIAAHPELNLFAAGHDGGMIVFKLDKERPPYCLHESECVFYVKEKYLRICEFSGSRDIPILTLKGKSTSPTLSIFGGSSRIKSVAYSAPDKAILVSYDQENSPYEIYLTKPGQSADTSESKKGSYATSVCFVGGKRIATLEISKGSTFNIVVRNLALEETKRCTLQPGQGWNGASIDYMWGTPIPGVVLLKGEDRVVLYDVQQRRTVSELVLQPVFDVKHIAWSHDHSFLALAGSDTILIVSKKLEPVGSLQEPSSKVKSIAWDETGVLLYSTNSHIKYCLPVNLNSNGSAAPLERGIVRTLDSVLYITAARGPKIFCLDRETKMRVIMVDNTEYTFKNALNKRQYAQVLKMVKEYNLMGDSIIAYLQNKGFPEVALHFVKDIGTKFNLAIECGNIEIALECAHKLDSHEYWNALGAEALKQGNHQILEMAYQRTKDYDRLSFLYLVTGNLDKLKKMQKIAEMRGDDASRFHNSLYLGDVQEQIKVLEKTGQLNLAYITAASHGLEEEKTALAMRICGVDKPEDISNEKLPQVTLQNPSLMMPPTPILRQFDSNWPLLNVSKGYFDGMSSTASVAPVSSSGAKLTEEEQEQLLNNPDSQWEDLEIPGETPTKKPQKAEDGADQDVSDVVEEAKGEWDLELDPEVEQALAKTEKASKSAAKSQIAVLPSVGPALSDIWAEGSTLPVDHFAAGQFDSAFAILRDTVGVVNFAPLKPLALAVFGAAKASLPVMANTDPLLISLSRNVASATSLRDLLPSLPATLSLQYLIDVSLKDAFKLTTAGKFGDALTNFQNILHSILFLAAEPKDKTEIKNLLSVCREYILGLRLELARKELATANGDVVRQAELAAYFTHCHLEQIHLLLSLRSAMNCFFKIKNYKSATNFAKRLLDLDPKEDVAQQALKVLKFCEQNPEDAFAIKYNERNPFVVCGISMVPIYKGSATVQCPFCTTHFLPEHAKKLCPSCGLAEIGKSASGLQVFAVEQKKSGNKKKQQQQDDEDSWD